jgi:hypothetical protein
MAVHFGVYACAAALTSRARTPANGAPQHGMTFVSATAKIA